MAFCFVLNRLLASEPWARERLAPFAGETIELRSPPLPALRLRIVEGGTLEASAAEPGLSMEIKPELIAALARGEDHAMRALEVQGNAKLASAILVLARHLRWDAEEAPSRLVGDIAARRIADAGRALAAWHLDAAQRLAAALADYVTDEKALLARRADLDALGESVIALRDAVARLDKRVQRLG